jgi:acyl-CoA synthetase (AMP-forming)/AMP-acid ligase II
VASIFALSALGAQYMVVDRDFIVGGRKGITHYLRSPERKGVPGLPYTVMDASWSPKVKATEPQDIARPGFADPADTCWILGSSGTTGRPKFVSIDQATVWKRLAVVRSDFVPGKTRVLLLFGCNTRPFGIRAVAALLSGCSIIDSHDLPFLYRHGVNLVCGSPAQLPEWLKGRTLSPRIERLQVSGARLDDALVDSLLHSFDQVEDVYGSSETIVAYVTARRRTSDGIRRSGRMVAAEVEIVDDAGLPVAKGAAGAVRIRNGHMATGYDDLPDETARRFRGGWFYPGDLATWNADGTLNVLGRSDDVVNLGGRKINLGDLDASLRASGAAVQACSFVDPFSNGVDRLAAVLQLRPGSETGPAVRASWEACAKVFGTDIAPATILVVDAMDMTQDGVPRRKLCRASFAQTLAQDDPVVLRKALFRFQAVTDAG